MTSAIDTVEQSLAKTANSRVIEEVYEAFAQNDVAALFALVDANCTIYQSSRLPWGGSYEGHAGLGEFLGKLTGHIASAVQTERLIDDEEGHVVAVGVTRGAVIATGVAFDVPEVHVWTVRDGKVTRFESYIDTGLMRSALGA